MDCTLIEGDLIPFHFGTLADEPRAAVETHLLSCARCLTAFLELKRAIERGQAAPRRPSQALRARLRDEVAAEFARPRRLGRVYGALAVAAVVALGVGLLSRRTPIAPAVTTPAASAPATAVSPAAGDAVDSARPTDAPIRFL